MPDYDLVIRGGDVHDGLGSPGRRADVAISGDRIAAIGTITGHGRHEIDASGHIVTPGFVDVHTHYDGQALWENHMSPSSNHGVTSVVMGNCGVGFAPCKPDQHDMLVKLMEGVEDIPEVVMTAGLPWNWESFPDYLDALDSRQLDIDIAAQLPHSALRVYVMGERGARREAPTADDLHQMRALTAEAIRAGALGVTTSRNILHRTRAGELAPSLESPEAELMAMAGGLKDAGAGVMQLIPDIFGEARDEFALMRRLAEAAGRPLSFTLLQMGTGDPDGWRHFLAELESANAEGVRIRGQVYPRPVGVLMGLDLSFHPFSLHPSFRPLAQLPLAEKVAALKDPAMRARLLAETPEDSNPFSLSIVKGFAQNYLMGNPPVYDPDISQRIDHLAAAAGQTAAEYAYDRLIENGGHGIFFLPGANYRDGNLSAALEMCLHPDTVIGLGDGGAHYGLICDASFPTFWLQHYARDADPGAGVPLPAAIRALTDTPARAIGLNDRGRLVPGAKADLNIIDLDRLTLHAPTMAHDLPAGGKRLQQGASGYAATIKSGVITYRNGVATGALPGRLVRGAQAMA